MDQSSSKILGNRIWRGLPAADLGCRTRQRDLPEMSPVGGGFDGRLLRACQAVERSRSPRSYCLRLSGCA